MSNECPARTLAIQLESESDLLINGDIAAVLEGLDTKRALIDRLKHLSGDRASVVALRSAAHRQQRLLRAALAGINAARSHLAGTAVTAPGSSYTPKGKLNPISPNFGTTLKML